MREYGSYGYGIGGVVVTLVVLFFLGRLLGIW